jgi:hypothetical protein
MPGHSEPGFVDSARGGSRLRPRDLRGHVGRREHDSTAAAYLVATLRGQVEEARTVAMGLASLARYLNGQPAVDLVCERMDVGAQPAWLEPSWPGWPLPAVPRPAS